jgi:hypothetical protein
MIHGVGHDVEAGHGRAAELAATQQLSVQQRSVLAESIRWCGGVSGGSRQQEPA